MSISTTYLLNVALHAVILSVFASLVLLVMRQARHRSVAAIAGLLAVGFLPWLTALRPAERVITPIPEIQSQAPILPTWTVAIVPAPTKIPIYAEPAATPEKYVVPGPLTILANLWVTGTGIGLFLLSIALLQVRRWRKSLLPLDNAAWQILQSLAPEIPARHYFRLSETTASPCVTGFFRPHIVLPRFLFAEGSEDGLRWAVRHEIAHWQAGDSRWMILCAIIRSVNWWNPLVHKLVSSWADASEQICDLHATGVSDRRADYGEFLVAMARRISNQTPLSVGMAKQSQNFRLRRRIESLLASNPHVSVQTGRRFLVTSLLLVAFSAIAVSTLKVRASDSRTDDLNGTEFPLNSAKPDVNSDSPSFRISYRLILWTKKTPLFDGGSYDDARITRIAGEAFAQRKAGGDFCWIPTFTRPFGKLCTLDAIEMKPGEPLKYQQGEQGYQKVISPHVGIQLTHLVRDDGGRLSIKIESDYRYIPGVFQPLEAMNYGTLAPARGWQSLVEVRRSTTAVVNPGQWLCTDLGAINGSRFLQLLTRIDPLQPASIPMGKMAPASDSPVEKPSGKF